MKEENDIDWGALFLMFIAGMLLGFLITIITHECLKTHKRKVAQQEEQADRITRIEKNLEFREMEAGNIYQKICRMQKTQDALDERVKALKARPQVVPETRPYQYWSPMTNSYTIDQCGMGTNILM